MFSSIFIHPSFFDLFVWAIFLHVVVVVVVV